MLSIERLNFRVPLNSHIWFPLFTTILRFIPATADFVYFILVGYALLGRRHVIETFFLSWLFSSFNPVIAPITEYDLLSRNIISLSCFFSILLRSNLAKMDSLVLFTVGLGFFFVVHSIFFSQIKIVSILKALNWTLIITALFLAWKGLNSLEYENTKKWMLEFLLIIALISLPLILVPEIGFFLNDKLFQGILNHPQVFGITIAGLGALLVGQLYNHKGYDLLLKIKILICFLLIYITGSRTAGFSLFFATMMSILFFNIFGPNKIILLYKLKKNTLFSIIIIFFLFLAYIFINEVRDFIISYMAKQTEFDSILSLFKNSREVIYRPIIDNIIENPLIGIGFGIGSDQSSMNIIYFNGIPVSAAVEKGVLPLAIWEEVGVFGLFFFIMWVLILIRRSIADSLAATIVILTFLLFNLSEAGLFSPGGLGMLYLIVLTSVLSKPKLIKKI